LRVEPKWVTKGIPVRITLIPSAFGAVGQDSFQFLTSYLINDVVAVDAGAIGFYQGPMEQAAIRHVFLSHSHMDHIASLANFLENIAGICPNPVTLYASEAVHESLRRDIFNGRVWPNFLELTHAGGRFVNVATIAHGQAIEVAGLRITPIEVNHTVPTLAFLLEEAAAAVVISSDTGPTERLWDVARQVRHLKAVFLECTFPDSLASLGEGTGHLTPASFFGEMQKLPNNTPFYAVHMRARYREQVIRELLQPQLPNLHVANFGVAYKF
jgi:ribonuclease BN (tRNA processing enzyme)